MKILHLTLKKKWFDMIASGDKSEEYREIKPYWISRLVDGLDHPTDYEKRFGFTFMWKGCGPHSMRSAEHYDIVQFRNGYAKDSPIVRVKIKDIVADFGKEEWGAEYLKPYFVIKLGNIID